MFEAKAPEVNEVHYVFVLEGEPGIVALIERVCGVLVAHVKAYSSGLSQSLASIL